MHTICPLDFSYFVLHQIYRLQQMQLTTNSSTPTMCWLARRWGSWMRKLKSFRLICWTAYYTVWSQFCKPQFQFIDSSYSRIWSFLRARLGKPPPQSRKYQCCIYTLCDRRRIIRFWRGLLHSIAFWLLRILFLSGSARPKINYSGSGSKRTTVFSHISSNNGRSWIRIFHWLSMLLTPQTRENKIYIFVNSN